jgi:hypothetical protein
MTLFRCYNAVFIISCYVLHGTGVSIGNLVYTLKISLIGVTNEY